MRSVSFIHYRRLRRDRHGRVAFGPNGWPMPEARGGATVRVELVHPTVPDDAVVGARPLGVDLITAVIGATPIWRITVAVCSLADVYDKRVGREMAAKLAAVPFRSTLTTKLPDAADLDQHVAFATVRTSVGRGGRLYRWLGRSAGILRARRADPQLALFSQHDDPADASPYEAICAWDALERTR